MPSPKEPCRFYLPFAFALSIEYDVDEPKSNNYIERSSYNGALLPNLYFALETVTVLSTFIHTKR